MKQTLVMLILLFGWSSGESSSPATQKKPATLPPGTSERVETSHKFNTQSGGGNHWGNDHFREVTITKNVPVPYPVKVEKHVAIPVKIPFPVAVQKKIPIVVEKKIPIYVEKPVPVQVDRPFPYPLPVEVPVFHKVAVEVPKPYPVHVPKPYPVYIRRPMFVEKSKSETNRIKKHILKGLRQRH